MTVALPCGAAARRWTAEATQYSATAAPVKVEVKVEAKTRDGAKGLEIGLGRRIAEPLAVWLRAAEDPQR